MYPGQIWESPCQYPFFPRDIRVTKRHRGTTTSASPPQKSDHDTQPVKQFSGCDSRGGQFGDHPGGGGVNPLPPVREAPGRRCVHVSYGHEQHQNDSGLVDLAPVSLAHQAVEQLVKELESKPCSASQIQFAQAVSEEPVALDAFEALLR